MTRLLSFILAAGLCSAAYAADTTEAMKAEYQHAAHGMSADMNMGSTSDNPDVLFVQGMLPHHQGAVDMAKTELKYGKDPEIRKLAEGIIKAQDAEIAQMKAWLAKQPK
ncbi:CopM family metallochaperone [Pseudomonas sp. RIT-To-2]|uniref:CopM family metallochaperone n=1 Tax=Pseudomonas sp. RIT-To-2 TaxID=3462541 RepID=UPI00227A0F66